MNRQDAEAAKKEERQEPSAELRGVPFARQVPVAVDDKGKPVGEARLDLVVSDSLVVELEAVESLAQVHLALMLSYLKATKRRLGPLVTFNVAVLDRGIKRVIRTP